MDSLGSTWAFGVCVLTGVACGAPAPNEEVHVAFEALSPDCSIESSVRRLPVPSGATGSSADAINERGDVAGAAIVDGTSVGAVWTKHDRFRALPAPGNDASAVAIDERRVVTGTYRDAEGNVLGFVWSRTNGVVALEALAPPGERHSDAPRAMNDRGSVVGRIETGDPDNGGVELAVRWSVEGPILDVLGTLGGSASEARAINDAGVVVGSSQLFDGGVSAFRWTEDDGMSALPLPSDVVGSEAVDINEQGEILVLFSRELGPASSGILRIDGSFDEVPTPAGYAEIQAAALNDAGWVVGSARLANGSMHPFVWNRSLSPFPLALSPGAAEALAFALNDRGEAVGNSAQRGVVWSLRCWH